jgi:hypothetical protein
MIRIYVEGIGLCGPGFSDWAASMAILARPETYLPAPASVPALTLLPANERRRAPRIVKIALTAGAEAFTAAGRDPAVTLTVFASSGGDGETIHDILNVLASPERTLSPTRFHNSVHNTAAGYWSIATGSRAASTSLSCYDDSFAAGLLEAAVQAAAGKCAVALIAYDVPYPTPLHEARPIGAAFAVALVLSAEPATSAVARIELELRPAAAESSTITAGALEMLRLSVPAARSLPLLAALARGVETDVTLSYLEDMTLDLHITPLAARSEP